MNKTTEYLRNLDDNTLLTIMGELQKEQVPEDSILRSVVKDVCGEPTIFALQCQELLWPLLLVITERFKSYSPHII